MDVKQHSTNNTTTSLLCRQLQHARSSFTIASLGLLANYRKRQQLIALLKSLRTIKTLVSSPFAGLSCLWFGVAPRPVFRVLGWCGELN